MAICDEIKSLYVFEEHSFQMSKVYGGDRGICAMATAAVGYVPYITPHTPHPIAIHHYYMI